ncbi:MAG: PQQ-binding-like beta-propeller repeat protein [Thermoanaerobaculia bacterium]|nr:PQQ-binding-like beta-propeller repeat protein [Thermoanaerobaculia bacterium]
MRRYGPATLAMLVGLAAAAPALGQSGTDGGDWRSYAADRASTKYSPLAQIDATNVDRLEVAWHWKNVDLTAGGGGGGMFGNLFETTPIAIGGRLYMGSGGGRAAAIDGATGATLWVFDPEEYGFEGSGRTGFAISRGLASWTRGDDRRLLLVSRGHLVSIDAANGRPNIRFGANGRVDLTDLGPDRDPLPGYFWTSPPSVCRDTVIVGNSTTDPYHLKEGVPGTIRGYDVHTGAMKWLFDIIPRPGQFGYETWENGSAEYSGHGNVWTWMSCDEELGLLYAPTSTPNDDWYGGHRHGDGLFGESIVALDIETGERRWHFQAVHHGLWDYDFPCAPILADVTVDGRPRKVIAAPSKQAILYVLDRVTGEPIWPIPEVEVPASDVPGEKASPTQPYPTRPLPYDLHGLTDADLIDLTPELHAEAKALLAKQRQGPIFLPPLVPELAADGKVGAVQSPGPVGGSDWNGGALDPETGIVYLPTVTAPLSVALSPPPRGNVDYMMTGNGFVEGPRGLPITNPPWGAIVAIDLNTGEHLWRVANGDSHRDHPALAGLDLPEDLGNRGRSSVLVTKTLLFAPDGSKDMIAVPPGGGGRGFRAFDKKTGEKLWEMELPAGATGAPMTYLAGAKQYIVIPLGEREYEGEFLALTLGGG